MKKEADLAAEVEEQTKAMEKKAAEKAAAAAEAPAAEVAAEAADAQPAVQVTLQKTRVLQTCLPALQCCACAPQLCRSPCCRCRRRSLITDLMHQPLTQQSQTLNHRWRPRW